MDIQIALSDALTLLLILAGIGTSYARLAAKIATLHTEVHGVKDAVDAAERRMERIEKDLARTTTAQATTAARLDVLTSKGRRGTA